jgi:hypothetical protein
MAPTKQILTNAREGIAHQHIHNPAATITRGDQNRTARLFADFSDHLRILTAGRKAQCVECGIRVLL